MLTDKEIQQRITEVISEEFELEPSRLVPGATLYDDLGLDSLDAVDMVVALEKSFGIKLANEEAIKAVRTMDDLCRLIINLKKEN
ncbi:MAG: acyl carrier protein [Desulfurivibrionaceae bacterium]|nr:acyl carrier protein [Desulfobulbales bacterium]MDT8334629.1 acyl carrier protein [Desulfurivibrionaceae bacterium]